MLTLDLEQKRPSEEEAQQMWGELQVTPVPFQHPALDELLERFRAIYVNGGAEFARFQLSENPVLQWFGSRNKLHEISFFERFLTAPAAASALPSLSIQNPLPSPLNLKEDTSAFTFDGEVAKVLVRGGSYMSFQGTASEAKAIGVRFCDALFGQRYDEIKMYISYDAWSPWFGNVAWDVTWFGVDKRNSQIWLLCATDTD